MTEPIGFLEHWSKMSHYSIEEAALFMIHIDPEIHQDYCERKPGYLEYFNDHPGGMHAYCMNVRIIASAIDARVISVTKPCKREDGSWEIGQTYILKSDLMAWWNQNGYHEVASALSPIAGAIKPNSTAAPEYSNQPSEPDDSTSSIARTLRGCQRHIVENWKEIVALYGDGADADQVLRVLKRRLEPKKPPAKKTIQNCLIVLRDKKLIP